jgi:hypothetical protein
LLIVISSLCGNGQDYFRLAADFSVKVKKSDGKQNLTMGKVYYDKNFKELIYDISFPQPEKWVISDTSLVIYRKDTLSERSTIPSINEFTVFHLALNSNLNDFGLKNSVYKVTKVEKKDSLVLSYWKIPKQASNILDFVVVAKKENRLESVVMFGDKSNILSRQFFRNYIRIGSFEFPGQIVQILYDKDRKENYQVTEFRNVKVNDLENTGSYRFIYKPKTK